MSELETQKEILTNAIQRKIESNQRTLGNIFIEAGKLNDSIAVVGKNTGVSFTANGTVKMNIKRDEEIQVSTLHPNAIYQIAQKFDIPAGYLREAVESKTEWKTQLASHILNEHTIHAQQQRLLLREVDNEIRGVLSDSYKRVDTAKIYSTFVEASSKAGLRAIAVGKTDLKSYIDVIIPEPIEIKYSKGKTYVTMGSRIQNSDFGASKYMMQFYIMQVACMNGMTKDNVISEIHKGKALPLDIIKSEETYKLENQTFVSQMKDAFAQVFCNGNLERQRAIIQRSLDTEIKFQEEFTKLKNAKQLSKKEEERAMSLLAGSRAEDGLNFEGENIWKFSNVISRLANEDDITLDRKIELQDLAGSYFKHVDIKNLQPYQMNYN